MALSAHLGRHNSRDHGINMVPQDCGSLAPKGKMEIFIEWAARALAIAVGILISLKFEMGLEDED